MCLFVWFEKTIFFATKILQDRHWVGNPWALAKLSEDRVGAREMPGRHYTAEIKAALMMFNWKSSERKHHFASGDAKWTYHSCLNGTWQTINRLGLLEKPKPVKRTGVGTFYPIHSRVLLSMFIPTI